MCVLTIWKTTNEYHITARDRNPKDNYKVII